MIGDWVLVIALQSAVKDGQSVFPRTKYLYSGCLVGPSCKQVSRWWKMEEEQVRIRLLICTQRKSCGFWPHSSPIEPQLHRCNQPVQIAHFCWLNHHCCSLRTPINLYLGCFLMLPSFPNQIFSGRHWEKPIPARFFSYPDCGGRAEVPLRTLWASHQQPPTFAGDFLVTAIGSWRNQSESATWPDALLSRNFFQSFIHFPCTWRNTIPILKKS